MQPKSPKIGCSLTIPSPNTTEILHKLKYNIIQHISVDTMRQNETNHCVECAIIARTFKREFSHNPDLGVAWLLHCQVWDFRTPSLFLVPRRAAGSARCPLMKGN